MLKDQKELLGLLNEYEVEYMVVGGHAVGAHGEPRLTKDLDILIRSNRDNSIAAFRALAAFGAPLAGTSAEDFCNKPTMVYQFGVQPARIDVLQRIEGVSLEDIWNRRVRREIEPGLEADFISLEDLIRNKESVGRLQDLADVENLRKVNGLA